MNAGDGEKPGDGATSPTSNPPPGSGEGADTALQALIKKRKLRAEDDAPAASEEPDPGLALP